MMLKRSRSWVDSIRDGRNLIVRRYSLRCDHTVKWQPSMDDSICDGRRDSKAWPRLGQLSKAATRAIAVECMWLLE